VQEQDRQGLASLNAFAQSSVKRSAVPGSLSKGSITVASDSQASTTVSACLGISV
jgi:hypothetical protein